MTNYDKMITLLTEYGMDKKWVKMFVKKLSDDEKAFTTDEITKRWALERGFFPGRVQLYGLTEENYKNYLPDFNYFMIHPINHHFRIWVNDKLTLKYVLNSNSCEDTMPKYYLYVENNGNYTYLMDAPEDIQKDKDFILNLLKREGTLAAKPNSGTSGGRGFMKLQYINGEIYENNNRIDLQEFNAIISELKNYIVTEYNYQHEDLAKIWPDSECTLRVVMVKVPSPDKYARLEWKCTVSFARFGSSITGGASNLSSGGIGVGFDFDTGRFKDFGIRYRRFCADGNWECHEHPDTHVGWANATLPNWDLVKQKILSVCNHISSLDYLGFDVIITPEGLKFCEINTHPAADYAQVICSPILSTEYARSFFKSKGLYDADVRKYVDAYYLSQE